MLTQGSSSKTVEERATELLDIFEVSGAVAYAMAEDEKAGRIEIKEDLKVITVIPKSMR